MYKIKLVKCKVLPLYSPYNPSICTNEVDLTLEVYEGQVVQ